MSALPFKSNMWIAGCTIIISKEFIVCKFLNIKEAERENLYIFICENMVRIKSCILAYFQPFQNVIFLPI